MHRTSMYRKVSPSLGIAEALSSSSATRLKPYVINNGPLCSFCDRRVYKLMQSEPATCYGCEKRIVTKYRIITEHNVRCYAPPEDKATRPAKTLVFMCARMSGESEKLPEGVFDTIWDDVKQSRSP
jgi:hypothetical protein